MKLYIVEDRTVEVFGQPKVVAALCKKKHFLEFVVRESVRRHQEHFNNWCSCHNADNQDFQVMLNYLALSFPEEIGKFAMVPARVNRNQVAQVFRLAQKYRPLGASYESKGEVHLKEQLDKQEEAEKTKLDN